MSGGTFVVRRATPADAEVIAAHRAAMFSEMHELAAENAAALREKSGRYLREAIASGEYVGFLASPGQAPDAIVAGAGAQVRNTLPHPRTPANAPHGRQAIVLNVYTDPAWRGRGAAELLMRRVIAWAGEAGMHTLVLHASDAGRPLYERLGFAATNEMRFTGALGVPELHDTRTRT